VSKLPTWSERMTRDFNSMPPSKIFSAIQNVETNHEIGNKNHKKIIITNIPTIEARVGHMLRPLSENPITKNIKMNPTLKNDIEKLEE
jgi:hypothetical protein